MGIVATRVHDANVLTTHLRTHARPKGKVGLLGHRERIHVGTKCNDRSWSTAAQKADDTMSADTGSHVDPKTAQMGGDHLSSAGLLEGELGMLMNVATPANDLWINDRRVSSDLPGKRLSAGRGRKAEGGEQHHRHWQ